MGTPRLLADVTFTAASSTDRATGLLGWIAATFDIGLRIDGITLRRTRSGKLTLAFPERTDGQGRRHPVVRPADAAARRAIEDAIFDALALTLPQDES